MTVLLGFFIAMFSIFISPYIFLYYRYPHWKYSFILISSFILSLSGVWVLILLSYYLNLSDTFIFVLAMLSIFYTLWYMYKHRNRTGDKNNNFLIWISSIILLLPLFQYMGTGFTEWDALVSWHKWALDLYHNEYHPINAAYPVLMPALLACIYKIQGTSDIWWTAKIALHVLPLVSLVLPLTLYKDYKDKTFIFVALFLYPYLLMRVSIEGAMDMPVMLMGMLTLLTLYTAEINKGSKDFEYYVYASLLLAGLTSITKQGGLAFIVFDIIYILLNKTYFAHTKRLILATIASLIYFLSFLSIYYLNAIAGVTGNLKLLKSLSEYTFMHKDLMWHKFFSYPPDIPILEPLAQLFHLSAITPYLLGFALLIFILKGTKQYNSIALLSVIFLVIGFFAWGKYASYHERNSYWVKTFLIMFMSINFSYFVTWYKEKRNLSIYIFFTFIVYVVIYLGTLDNTYAEKKQRDFQTKLGWEGLAKDVVHITEGKHQCFHIYTNDFTLLYNYHTKDIQDKITALEFTLDNLRDIIENNCSDGTYVTFRGSTHSYALWKKHIVRLIYDKKILPYKGNNGYLFYVPPHTSLPENYFDNRTIMVHKMITNYDDNISYTIEKISDNNKFYHLKGWAFIKGNSVDKSEKYLVLTKEEKQYIIATNIILRPDVTAYFKAKDLSKSGFKSYIYKKDFEEGVYDISLLLIDKNKKKHFIKTDKKITIDYHTIFREKGEKNESN